jgi:hypothetical protein
MFKVDMRDLKSAEVQAVSDDDIKRSSLAARGR